MGLIVLAGTSGSGKNSIVTGLLDRFPDLWVSLSTTTRPPRPGEVEGVDYHFATDAEFDAMVESGQFLEWFEIYGHRSGTPRGPLEKALDEGRTALLWLDVQGALRVKDVIPGAVLVFVKAPSREEQRRRLEARGDQVAAIERRMAAADREEAQAAHFDHVIVNDDLDQAVDAAATIVGGRSGP